MFSHLQVLKPPFIYIRVLTLHYISEIIIIKKKSCFSPGYEPRADQSSQRVVRAQRHPDNGSARTLEQHVERKSVVIIGRILGVRRD